MSALSVVMYNLINDNIYLNYNNHATFDDNYKSSDINTMTDDGRGCFMV